jgi:hypothetical protein
MLFKSQQSKDDAAVNCGSVAGCGHLQMPSTTSSTAVGALDLVGGANPRDFPVAMEVKGTEAAVQVVVHTLAAQRLHPALVPEALAAEHEQLPLGSVHEVCL